MRNSSLSHFSLALSLQVWLKPAAEMQFLYGNHVLKSGLGRITEATPAYTGVVVYSMSDVPLGFGVAAKTTADCRKADPNAIVVFHQVRPGYSDLYYNCIRCVGRSTFENLNLIMFYGLPAGCILNRPMLGSTCARRTM